MLSPTPQLPPSFVVPGQLEKRSQNQQLTLSSGKSIMNDGAMGIPSPAKENSFTNSARSPLQQLGSPNSSLGLRQRRNGQEPMAGAPPKLSMSTMGSMLSPTKVATKSMSEVEHTPGIRRNDPETKDVWGLVYGFATDDQKAEVLAFLKDFGSIQQTRRLSDSNWVAVKYETKLGLDKARCYFPKQLKSGGFVGILELTDIDHFLQKQQKRNSSFVARGLFGNVQSSSSTGDNGAPRPLEATTTTTFGQSGEVGENDIFVNNVAKNADARRSVCESVMAWIYGW